MKKMFLSFIILFSFSGLSFGQVFTFEEIIKLSECKDSMSFAELIKAKDFSYVQTVNQSDQKTYLYISNKKVENENSDIQVTPTTISFSNLVGDSTKSTSIIIKTMIVSQLHNFVSELYSNNFEPYISKKGKYGVEGVYYQSNQYVDLDVMVGTYSDIYNSNNSSKFYYIEIIKLEK
jgi:hypothetical protein